MMLKCQIGLNFILPYAGREKVLIMNNFQIYLDITRFFILFMFCFCQDLLQFTDDNHSDRYYLVASLAILRNFLNQLNEEIQHVVQLVEEEGRR